MNRDIVVLGSLNIDFVVRASRRPEKGETVPGKEFSLFPGGKGANQAAAAAKLGGNVAIAGRIGDDVFSKVLLDSLSSAQVGQEHIVITPGVSTGSAFITVDDTGENSIIVVPGANGCYGRSDVDTLMPYLKKARVLMLQLEVPLEAVTYAARLAHACGVKVMLDPAPPVPLAGDLLRAVDIITPNEHEASFLTGRAVTDVESAKIAAADMLSRGVKAAVIKLGAGGVVYAEGSRFGFIPGHSVQVVDTTAAGDAFSGGLAVALCEGKDLGEACRFANGVAALSVTRKGAQTSMPERSEVDTFLYRLKSV
ncbi:MAG: ribokinase [Bacillota bacterium]|jgi:ribokinase